MSGFSCSFVLYFMLFLLNVYSVKAMYMYRQKRLSMVILCYGFYHLNQYQLTYNNRSGILSGIVFYLFCFQHLHQVLNRLHLPFSVPLLVFSFIYKYAKFNLISFCAGYHHMFLVVQKF